MLLCINRVYDDIFATTHHDDDDDECICYNSGKLLNLIYIISSDINFVYRKDFVIGNSTLMNNDEINLFLHAISDLLIKKVRAYQ